MENRLLKIIKENNEKFNEKWDELYIWKPDWDPVQPEDEYIEVKSDIKSHITQSRIKELEALVKMIKETDNCIEENAEIIGDRNCREGVIKVIQEIINQLKLKKKGKDIFKDEDYMSKFGEVN